MKKTYLIDTSAWIEYLRATGSDADAFVTELLTRDREIVTTEPIIAELLAGAKTPTELMQLERLTGGLPLLSVDNRGDYHELGRICRGARVKGKTIRKLSDCLIAAVALRTDAVVVHNDRDFDRIAEVFPTLRTQRHNRN